MVRCAHMSLWAVERVAHDAHTKAVDVWATGIVVYVLLCGVLPFSADGSAVSAEGAKVGIAVCPWAWR